MSIAWPKKYYVKVQAIFTAHPAESGECEDVARKLLPLARQVDAQSASWKLLPSEGRFIVPIRAVGRRWYDHYCVETQKHYVDALTGAPGTPCEAYLDEHWQHPDALRWVAVDL